LIKTNKEPYNKKRGNGQVRDVGPRDFLSLIHNAKYVVTNSFHGIAFSLNYKKQFYVETIDNARTNSRMCDLIDELNLQSCYINNYSEENIINYEEVSKKIDMLKKESLKYIEGILYEEK